jgi:integrase
MKTRVVPLVPEARILFPLVITDLKKGKRILTRKALLQALNAAVDRVNTKGEIHMESLTLHDLRRTFATRCIEQEVSLPILANILGHASVSTTASFYVSLTATHAYEALLKATTREPLGSSENAAQK